MNKIQVETDRIVDANTGEVITETQAIKTVKSSANRPYIKFYIDDHMYDLIGLQGRAMDLFLYCLKECDYSNLIVLNKRRRDEIRNLTGIKNDSSVRKLISTVAKKGLLIRKSRGEYEVNSLYFYKGRETQSPYYKSAISRVRK